MLPFGNLSSRSSTLLPRLEERNCPGISQSPVSRTVVWACGPPCASEKQLTGRLGRTRGRCSSLAFRRWPSASSRSLSHPRRTSPLREASPLMLSHSRTSPPTVKVGTPARPHPLALPPPPTPQPSPRQRPLPSPQCRGAYAPCSRAGSSALRGVTWPPAPPHRRRHHPRARLAFPRVGLAGGSTSPPPPSKLRPSLGPSHSSRPPSRPGSVPRVGPARACGSTSSPSTSFSLCRLFRSCSLSVVDRT